MYTESSSDVQVQLWNTGGGWSSSHHLLWTVLRAVPELQSLSLQYCATADIFKDSSLERNVMEAPQGREIMLK